MSRPGLALAMTLLLGTGAATPLPAAAAGHCGVEAACPVAGGSYRVSPPAAWDGSTKLPTALFFHGYQGSADDQMRDEALRRQFAEAGVLLVFPDGRGRTWAHQGSPAAASAEHGRDEVAFVRAVLADLRQRWPLDEARLWAVGFSQGGSMVWDLACRGGLFEAHVAIAGAFWMPLPTACPAGPVDLFHIHGLSDATVPIEGRTLRAGAFTQGDLFAGMAIMRAVNGCSRAPDGYASSGAFVLRGWLQSCASGRQLVMALHDGGHELPEGWFAQAWGWVQRVTGPVPAALGR